MLKLTKIIAILLFVQVSFAQSRLITIMGGKDYGAELVTNGTFDSNITGWSQYTGLNFNTFEWSAGKLHLICSGSRSLAGGTAFAIVSGVTYRVRISVNVTSGALDAVYINRYPYSSVVKLVAVNFTTDREVDIEFVSNYTGNAHVTFDETSACNVLIDNVSIREVK